MNDAMGTPTPAPEDQPKKSNQGLIIAIVVIVVLCCCCAAAAAGWWAWNNGDQYLQNFGSLVSLLA